MRRSSGGLSEKNVFDLLPVCIGKLMNRPSVRGRIPGGEHQSRDERATNETGSGWPGAAYANMFSSAAMSWAVSALAWRRNRSRICRVSLILNCFSHEFTLVALIVFIPSGGLAGRPTSTQPIASSAREKRWQVSAAIAAYT